MAKQILGVRVAEVQSNASSTLRNGSTGGYCVECMTEILPGKTYWSAMPQTFLTEEAAAKQAKKLAKKFNCEVK